MDLGGLEMEPPPIVEYVPPAASDTSSEAIRSPGGGGSLGAAADEALDERAVCGNTQLGLARELCSCACACVGDCVRECVRDCAREFVPDCEPGCACACMRACVRSFVRSFVRACVRALEVWRRERLSRAVSRSVVARQHPEVPCLASGGGAVPIGETVSQRADETGDVRVSNKWLPIVRWEAGHQEVVRAITVRFVENRVAHPLL
eukprot:4006959-Pleurochrysis_carterae.AAC.3